MLDGFKKFIMKGNVVDLAVGVVIGAAFGALVKQFTDSFINPLIQVLTGGGIDGGTFTIDGVVFDGVLQRDHHVPADCRRHLLRGGRAHQRAQRSPGIGRGRGRRPHARGAHGGAPRADRRQALTRADGGLALVQTSS
jgi:Large-conductance mechanosensitive channel, MscL